jgi:hypothetical protein
MLGDALQGCSEAQLLAGVLVDTLACCWQVVLQYQAC